MVFVFFMKERWVISLGGSRIVPSSGVVDYKFIEKFKELILKHPSKKFVVVTGGGSTARKYISALRKFGKENKEQSLAGIAITRFHASFLAKVFGKIANPSSFEDLPRNMGKVKKLLRKNQVVFCGGLRYSEKSTSDATSAKLANFLDCDFINLTNVKGIYSSNPKKNKNAKFIKKISWGNFLKMAEKIKYKAGQHFVLDQEAARIIAKEKIKTYIVGSLKDVDKIVSGKGFSGSLISG